MRHVALESVPTFFLEVVMERAWDSYTTRCGVRHELGRQLPFERSDAGRRLIMDDIREVERQYRLDDEVLRRTQEEYIRRVGWEYEYDLPF